MRFSGVFYEVRAMLFVNRSNGRKANELGTFTPVSKPGVHSIHTAEYRGFRYQVRLHKSGFTVTRPTFRVSISRPTGERAAFLDHLASKAAARSAAEQWIDAALEREQDPDQRAWRDHVRHRHDSSHTRRS